MLRIDLEELSNTIQYEFGSVYVNDFNLLNRVFRVVAQSDSEFRSLETDLDRVWVKNELGRMVPLSSAASIERTSGPQVIARYNMYPSVFVLGNISDSVSSTEAISVIERMAAETLPEGISLQWTSMIKEQKQEDNTNLYIFRSVSPVCFPFLSGSVRKSEAAADYYFDCSAGSPVRSYRT